MEAEDSWEDLKEVPVKDLAQSGSDSERVEAAPAKANVWVSEESDDDMANSREEDAPLPVVAVANPVQVLDDTSSLASEIYKLEDQLATSEMVETLRAEKALLEQRLAEAQRMISDRDQRIKELRVNQLEILQAMSVLKKNHRQFQLGLLKIVETLPPPKAAAELENLISGQIAQQRALESAAETKFMQDDASCLTR
jgi:flagellar motility protein MotE (MotC chaperone)